MVITDAPIVTSWQLKDDFPTTVFGHIMILLFLDHQLVNKSFSQICFGFFQERKEVSSVQIQNESSSIECSKGGMFEISKVIW